MTMQSAPKVGGSKLYNDIKMTGSLFAYQMQTVKWKPFFS